MPDNGQRRAATYSRVSTWDRHGDSIESQQQVTRDDGTRAALLFVDDEHVADVELPPHPWRK